MPTPPPAAPTPDDWLALDHQLCFALYAASLAMTKAYKPLLAPLGLTYPQYLVLLVLWEDDGLSVSRLGERLTLDSGTLTPLLKRLEAQGLLHRRRDSSDERRVLLDLTPAGQALRQQALAVPQAIACASACDLSQISALAAQLHTLRRQLQPDAPPPASISPAAARVAALPSTSTKD
jgi:DNA-binding MarR family transcriptional regulator